MSQQTDKMKSADKTKSTDNIKSAEKIKSEDKKALCKFKWMLIAAVLIGAVSGLVTGMAGFYVETDLFEWNMAQFVLGVFPWMLGVITVVITVIIEVLYRKCRRGFAQWDGEDEDVIEEIERKISWAMWFASLLMICSFFVFGSCTVYIDRGEASAVIMFVLLIVFAAAIICVVISQQNLVNLTKEINPEKSGSVYDMKFQKKWEESCDEAEKLQIYQCGFRAYTAAQTLCLILWVICVLGGFVFRMGIMPMVIITVIWGGMTTVYAFEAIKLSGKHKR